MYLSCLHFEMNKIYTYGSLDVFMLHLLHEEVLQNVYNSLANILSISTYINKYNSGDRSCTKKVRQSKF